MSRRGTCAIESGFLFAHACALPAVQHCTACGKPSCAEHSRLSDAGVLCVSCEGRRAPAAGDQPTEAGAGHHSAQDDSPYFYHGYYGNYGRYGGGSWGSEFADDDDLGGVDGDDFTEADGMALGSEAYDAGFEHDPDAS